MDVIVQGMERESEQLYEISKASNRSLHLGFGSWSLCLERVTMKTTTQHESVKMEQHTSRAHRPVGPHYKWIALTNTTLGVLMASIDISIVLISLPAIFNG